MNHQNVLLARSHLQGGIPLAIMLVSSCALCIYNRGKSSGAVRGDVVAYPVALMLTSNRSRDRESRSVWPDYLPSESIENDGQRSSAVGYAGCKLS